MHATRGLVAASLVQAVLWGTVAAAQPSAPPPEATSPDAASDVDERRKTPAEQPANTKETDTSPTRPADSRGPRVTQLDEVLVEADRPLTAASSDVIRARDYALRPHSTTQEILNNVPGLLVVQHAGGGKAVQYFLRGFDIDHGTDLALFTDGIPVNMVTNGHGQGYADINYLIPETVDTLQLFKGPYFVELGDFATAGALKFTTKDEFRENFALAEGGSFDTQRYVLGGSVPLNWAKTLLAAEAYFTNGPFDNPEHYARYNVFGKLTFSPFVDQRLSFLASVYSGDWDGSGQIPLRIVGGGPGEIDRFASLDPTEGGSSDRENLSAQWNYKPSAQEEWSAQLWGSRYHLRLFSDFTFFKDAGLRFYRPTPGAQFVDRCAGLGLACPDLPDPSIALDQFIPGDGIQQDDTRLLFGGYIAYNRFYSLSDVPWLGDLPMQTEFGLQTRRDDIDVALWRQVQRNRFFAVNKVGVEEQSVSGYWGQQIFFTDWARLEGGLRGDVFFFNVRNRLPQQNVDANFSCLPNADGVCASSGVPTNNDGAVLIQGNEIQGLPSPKANLVLGPWYGTDVYANFGYGYHSNDARAVVLSGRDGLVPALGYELGSRTRQFDRLDVAAALWLLDLESELVFSGDGGGIDADPVTDPDGEPIAGNFFPGPPSRRWGVDFETRYQFTDWLFADYDLSWADPRFKNGDAIPLAPTLLMNGGVTADFASFSNFLNGFAGALRFRYLDNRPANEERTFTAEGFALLDILLRYRWRNFEASLSFLNITDAAWRQSQFVEATCVNQIAGLDFGQPANNNQPCLAGGNRPNQVSNGMAGVFADGIDGITFTPGIPFAVRGGLQIFF
jgi:hypothetical protein